MTVPTPAPAEAHTPMPQSACIVCGSDPVIFRWTDTHGVAVCTKCGLPYTLIHYEGEGAERKRIQRDPEPALTDSGVAVAARYWVEAKRMVFPGCFDVPGSNCSGWTMSDVETFDDWYRADAALASARPTGSP